MNRRSYLGTLAAVGAAGLAGCSNLAEFIADQALKDVNVFADVSETVTIHVRIESPDGGTVFDETSSFNGNDDEPAQYEDVWTTTGEHTVTAALDDGPSATETTGIEALDDSVLVTYSEEGFEIGTSDELD